MSAVRLPYRLPDADERLLRAAVRGGLAVLELPSPAAQAYLAWCLRGFVEAPVVWIVDSAHSMELLAQNLEALAPPDEGRLVVFPPRPPSDRLVSPGGRLAAQGERMEVLRKCGDSDPPSIIATCISALLQPTPSPAQLIGATMELVVGHGDGPDTLREFLDRGGYEWVPQVESRGQAAARGGIVDVWPPTAAWPIRVEFFGRAVDSLRAFDPLHQRSVERMERSVIDRAVEPPGVGCFLDVLPPGTLLAWVNPPALKEHAETHRRAEGTEETAPDYGALRARWTGRSLEFVEPAGTAALRLSLRELDPFDLTVADPETMAARRGERVRELADRSRRGGDVWVFFATAGARDRFCELHADAAREIGEERLRVGPLSDGFEVADGSLTVAAESDLFPRRLAAQRPAASRRRAAAEAEGERLLDPGRMEPGELVVHVEHGVGRYHGIVEIQVGGRPQEALAIEYAEGARLYVPIDQAHLLSRYVGIGGRPPELHRLGSRRWSLERTAAERAVHDLAARLLETQATRQLQPGRSTGPDTPWQAEFEAAFPFPETEDQARVIAEVKRDLEAPRPMDRLICGDVGYGKTEVAMRAAFKTVMSGAQVAMLVPTTVLAQQHYDTFRERMAAFPISIEMLSRFRTRAEQRAILGRLRDGSLDIVIGTHRLIQPDVEFRCLGLAIIDEEQRFGVEHKEALKRWRRTVDALTMTATPIPRTLYMGLIGARDLSVIETPPQDRLPIETAIQPWDDELVRSAILREIDRGGQVFFLHNRVATIGHRLEMLRQLVPEARIEAAHGQMAEQDLAALIRRFGAGDFDVLLCTTIIESGVDMPRVNTILIERADRFGLADLYQLRGRVGRYRHQAYAFLLLPRHGRLLDTARRRIAALRRHTGLGAGFRLALRDLEARGAGNLLGAEQSGHIAAVGFDLYCQLLRRTMATLRGEPPPRPATARLALDFIRFTPDPLFADEAAAIPSDYIDDEPLRLQVYRRIAGAVDESELDEIAAELRDRFGPLPAPLSRLLELGRLKILASAADFEKVETDGDRAFFYRDGEPWMSDGRLPRIGGVSPDDRIGALVRLARRLIRARSG